MTCPVCESTIIDGERVVVLGISNHFLPSAISNQQRYHADCVEIQGVML